MSDWQGLLAEYLSGGMTDGAFHDRFLALWRRDRDFGLPPAIEQLFYVVEAFTPDPALRDTGQPWEADEEEMRSAAWRALDVLLHGTGT